MSASNDSNQQPKDPDMLVMNMEQFMGWAMQRIDAEMGTAPAPEPTKPAAPICECGGTMHRSRTCGVFVCDTCGYHQGLVRCFCGWAADGGDGAEQLRDMGENLDDDY